MDRSWADVDGTVDDVLVVVVVDCFVVEIGLVVVAVDMVMFVSEGFQLSLRNSFL